MGRRRKGRASRRNLGAGASSEENAELVRAPHSFVVHRGAVGRSVQELTSDFRRMMEPFTATNIKVRPKNTVKDFAHVAGQLHVSHMCAFTKTAVGAYLKVGRFPRGPTLTFRVHDYVLARDVRSSLKRQITYQKQYLNAPLLIMNGFGEDAENEDEAKSRQLTSSMFQNMFPSINVTTVKVNSIRRCVLLNRDPNTGLIDFRHYTIKVIPAGVSRAVKKLVRGKVPNLSRYDDVAEFLARGGAGAVTSDSEAENEEEASKVTLTQPVSSRGNAPSQQSSVRLAELGPRMTLDLVKIEEGLLEGEILYHKLVEKTEEEKRAIRMAREKRQKEKEKRRREQNLNVKRKEEIKQKHKEKSLKGMKTLKKMKEELPEGFHGVPQSSEEDNDAEWYEKEVGEKPDKDMFDEVGDRKRRGGASGRSRIPSKRFKKKSADSRGSDKTFAGRSSVKRTVKRKQNVSIKTKKFRPMGAKQSRKKKTVR